MQSFALLFGKMTQNSLTLGTLDILDHFSHSSDTRVNKAPSGDKPKPGHLDPDFLRNGLFFRPILIFSFNCECLSKKLDLVGHGAFEVISNVDVEMTDRIMPYAGQ